MGLTVTDLARVPSEGWDWYIFLLEDDWVDALRDELRDNFETLGNQVGKESLVVRGYNREEFSSQIYNSYRLYFGKYQWDRFPFPTLLVTNMSPPEGDMDEGEFSQVIMILFPLAEKYIRPGSISDFLRDLSSTLRDPNAEKALETYDPSKIQNAWGWINRYFEIKPEFLGISADVNALINDYIFNGKGNG